MSGGPPMVLDLALLGVLAVGSTLALDGLALFRRAPLAARLAPYAPATTAARRPSAGGDLRRFVAPLAVDAGNRLARAVGLGTDLELRLRRARRDRSPTEFRLAQFTHALLALAGAGTAALALRPGPVPTAVMVLGAPVLAALADEQSLDRRAERHREALAGELPVITEQLGLLFGAGYSVQSALARIARRGQGTVAADLARVVRRIRQGLSESAALAEWATLVDLDAVDRLVGVLGLHREAADLSALVSTEAAAMRAEAHRRLVGDIERRAQLVWIPVTVATLVPGLVLLAVPFVAAVSRVTGG